MKYLSQGWQQAAFNVYAVYMYRAKIDILWPAFVYKIVNTGCCYEIVGSYLNGSSLFKTSCGERQTLYSTEHNFYNIYSLILMAIWTCSCLFNLIWNIWRITVSHCHSIVFIANVEEVPLSTEIFQRSTLHNNSSSETFKTNHTSQQLYSSSHHNKQIKRRLIIYICFRVDCVPVVKSVEGHECDLSRKSQSVHLLKDLGTSAIRINYVMKQSEKGIGLCKNTSTTLHCTTM